MITYSMMSEREASMHRALSRIEAAGGIRPGHPDYMSKDDMAALALRVIRGVEDDLRAEQAAA